MSAHATAPQASVLTASTFAHPFHRVVGQLRRAAGLAGDVLLLGTVIFLIPFAILAIGIPVAFFVQLLLWIVRLF